MEHTMIWWPDIRYPKKDIEVKNYPQVFFEKYGDN